MEGVVFRIPGIHISPVGTFGKSQEERGKTRSGKFAAEKRLARKKFSGSVLIIQTRCTERDTAGSWKNQTPTEPGKYRNGSHPNSHWVANRETGFRGPSQRAGREEV